MILFPPLFPCKGFFKIKRKPPDPSVSQAIPVSPWQADALMNASSASVFDNFSNRAIELHDDRKQPYDHVNQPSVEPNTILDWCNGEGVQIAEAESTQHSCKAHDDHVIEVSSFLPITVNRHPRQPVPQSEATDDKDHGASGFDCVAAAGSIDPQPVGFFS